MYNLVGATWLNTARGIRLRRNANCENGADLHETRRGFAACGPVTDRARVRMSAHAKIPVRPHPDCLVWNLMRRASLRPPVVGS